MRILIGDDHAVLRDGLKRILANEFTDASFGEAANTTEALAQLWEKPWELVLLDVSMRGRSGLDVLSEIRGSLSKVPVLVLSAHPVEQYALRALKAERLAAEVQSSDRPAHESLSNREYQVMLLIAAGKVPKEVGAELCLSVKTVGTYRTRILEKLKLRNNAEIMRYVWSGAYGKNAEDVPLLHASIEGALFPSTPATPRSAAL